MTEPRIVTKTIVDGRLNPREIALVDPGTGILEKLDFNSELNNALTVQNGKLPLNLASSFVTSTINYSVTNSATTRSSEINCNNFNNLGVLVRNIGTRSLNSFAIDCKPNFLSPIWSNLPYVGINIDDFHRKVISAAPTQLPTLSPGSTSRIHLSVLGIARISFRATVIEGSTTLAIDYIGKTSGRY